MHTITLSIPKPVSEVITTSLKGSFLQRIQVLIQNMREGNVFSAWQLELLQQWESRLIPYFQLPTLQTNEEKEKAAQELCNFLVEFIRPAYLDELDGNKQSIIVEYELLLKVTLGDILQKDEQSIEDYIEDIQLAYDEQEFLDQTVQTSRIAQAVIQPCFSLDSIRSLVRDMLECPLFSLPEQQLIKRWEQESIGYFQDLILRTAAGKETAAQVLSFLLIDIIRPAYLSKEDKNTQRAIFAFEQALKLILEDLLQEDESFIENYIASIQSLCHEQDGLEEALKEIEEQTEAYLNSLLQHATTINVDLVQQFENLKAHLLRVHNQAQKDSQQVAERLMALMNKVQDLFEIIKTQTSTIQELSDRIIKDNQVFDRLCQDIFNLMGKL